MRINFEFRDWFLLVTVTGHIGLSEALGLFKESCDEAVKRGLNRILFDASAADGNLTDDERYELGNSMGAYYFSKSLSFKVATVGTPPLVNGLGAQVASSRGLDAKTFSDVQVAMDWLNQLD